jgi:hypothetical protein
MGRRIIPMIFFYIGEGDSQHGQLRENVVDAHGFCINVLASTNTSYDDKLITLQFY